MTTTSSGMLTDRYELTMLRCALADGTAGKHSVFEAFTRRLPRGRRYGVVGGTGRLLEAIEAFGYTEEQLAWMETNSIIDKATRDYLTGWKFSGEITGYMEGETYFPGSPILTVEGPFGDCTLLETLILSTLNHDSAIAAAASRMKSAAGGRSLIEMGSRRTHEEAAVAASRTAWLNGFDASSNLAAGYQYGVPTLGTAAHAWVLAHENEEDAFTAQIAALGEVTTLLVDTHNTERGIRLAARAAGPGKLGGVRLDSGDLGQWARRAREILDEEGQPQAKIVVTSDLDEHLIADLASAPVDAYGVGTKLVDGSGHTSAGIVYKLVAIQKELGKAEMINVAKSSAGKQSTGGKKTATRLLGKWGKIEGEILTTGAEAAPAGRPLQVTFILGGKKVSAPASDQIKAAHNKAIEELTIYDLMLDDGTPRIRAEKLAEAHLNEEPTKGETPMHADHLQRKALIIVDTQNDFIHGSLPVSGGDEAATKIGHWTKAQREDYDLVVATMDWHENPGDHFAEDPDYRDTWPAHCVAGTHGAELHEGLSAGAGQDINTLIDKKVRKGLFEAAYSGFQGADETGAKLDTILQDAGIEAVEIVGIAGDYCVKATALDAAKLGYEVTVLTDLTASVTGAGELAAWREVRSAGATTTRSAWAKSRPARKTAEKPVRISVA